MQMISKAPDLGPVPPRPDEITKSEMESALDDCYGLTPLVAIKLDTSIAHVQSLVEQYGLEVKQAQNQRAILEKAKAAVLQSLDSDNERTRLRAAEILLRQAPQLAVQINAQQVDVKELFGA